MHAMNKFDFPQPIRDLVGEATLWDTSGHSGAKTYYIDKGCGYYLKIWDSGKLRGDERALSYFAPFQIAPKPVLFCSADRDYLVTERLRGYPASNQRFVSQPDKLAVRLGKILREFHDSATFADCPLRNTSADMLLRVENNYKSGNVDEKMLDYVQSGGMEAAYTYILENKQVLRDDAVLHGDFCLPNILLDDEMMFTGFLDLNAAGLGDRHYDIHWGKWSLSYNIGTRMYEQLFMDSYGRDAIDAERLKVVSYISCLEDIDLSARKQSRFST